MYNISLSTELFKNSRRTCSSYYSNFVRHDFEAKNMADFGLRRLQIHAIWSFMLIVITTDQAQSWAYIALTFPWILHLHGRGYIAIVSVFLFKLNLSTHQLTTSLHFQRRCDKFLADQWQGFKANKWRRLLFMNILDVASKVMFLTIILKHSLFFSTSVE